MKCKNVYISVLGDSGTGKTSLIEKYIHNTFSNNTETEKDNVYLTHTFYKKVKIPFVIQELSGDHLNDRIMFKSISISLGYIIIYSVTSRTSFENIEGFTRLIWRLTNIRSSDGYIPVTIIGTKSDIYEERVVSTSEGKDYATKHNFAFYEISLKNDENVDPIFKSLFENIFTKSIVNCEEFILNTKNKQQQKVNHKKMPKKIENNTNKCCAQSLFLNCMVYNSYLFVFNILFLYELS
ncbi:hypothetical protein EIN_171200 [Entamoeba invadens IP1]|uniref:small monomeric GTPase n=1 Tax=Entamoeba invadens IP1 TaxID=370355 RepID=A0A0A1TYD9_ENTIV|nr:hypothetical protein EIN_171200 [Entamoeba invadens IP1]ELP84565.1 hypothetical protein EIN_171200 [Entamoeba invadens IP1]|eukprot:XP_004183911.1 hypothetical protein EIN_171200 [Entamoeba invadens IP1]